MKIKILACSGLSCCLFLLTSIQAALGTTLLPGDVQYERVGGTPSELKSFPPSIFPHWRHRIHYRCDVCHDSIFEMKHGATPVSKDLMKEGKVCGVCHNNKLAFGAGLQDCHRCHVTSDE